jgi:hypothetical protein
MVIIGQGDGDWSLEVHHASPYSPSPGRSAASYSSTMRADPI